MNFNATLIGQMITFTLLVIFTMKYIWPPVMQAMQERQRRIAEGLAAAERGQQSEATAMAKADEALREAKRQASDILAQAQKRATEIVEQSKQDAQLEGERQLAAARAQIDQEFNRVREQLRGEVVNLALVGAGRILKHEVNPNVHAQLLNELAAQL